MDKQAFDVFIEDPEDIVGAVSYGLYKQHKASFVRDFTRRNGQAPSQVELELFTEQCLLPEAQDGYRKRAQLICNNWLNCAIEEGVRKVAASTRDSELAILIANVIQTKLDERRTWTGWLRDAATSLMTTTLALILVGLLGFGVKLYDVFNSKVERVVEIHAPDHPPAR